MCNIHRDYVNLRWLSRVNNYSTAVAESATWRQREASAASGHMTSQLIFSTSAWPASVYKSAHGLQQQNEESCVICSGILKLYDYVRAVTLTFTQFCVRAFVSSVCLSNCMNRPVDRSACNVLIAELGSRSLASFLTQSATNQSAPETPPGRSVIVEATLASVVHVYPTQVSWSPCVRPCLLWFVTRSAFKDEFCRHLKWSFYLKVIWIALSVLVAGNIIPGG